MRQLSFQRMFVTLHKQDDVPVGVPTQLSGNSIYLQGTIDGIPFTFSSSETNALEASGPNAIAPAGRGLLLLEFHIGRIIKKLDLSSISSSADISNSNKYSVANPCPMINPTLSDIYTCFKEGLETESNLGVDLDADFVLESTDETVD